MCLLLRQRGDEMWLRAELGERKGLRFRLLNVENVIL